jgi:uncharacterized protein YjaG (DUF416 family)
MIFSDRTAAAVAAKPDVLIGKYIRKHASEMRQVLTVTFALNICEQMIVHHSIFCQIASLQP